MRFAYRYRLYPTRAQAQFLDRELKEACSLYNAANQERDDAWKTCRKSINYYDQANQLKAMRTDVQKSARRSAGGWWIATL